MIDSKPIDRLILGHMPLVGISYQSKEIDAEYQRRFNDAVAMRDIVNAAIDLGVSKSAAASPNSSPLAPLHLQVLKEIVDEGHNIKLIPCIGIPVKIRNQGIDAFRRWATYLTLEERLHSDVRLRILDDPILNFRERWKEKLPVSKPYDKEDFQSLSIDWEKLELDLEYFIDLPVLYIEPGSETDFLAVAGRFDLLGGLIDRVKERGFSGVLFGVHHAGVTIPRMDDDLDGFDGYITPINPLGLMMFPTKATAEKAVTNTKKRVIAIKPLAGGRVKPEEAFKYVFSFDVDGCMIGCASVAEVKEDFTAAIGACAHSASIGRL